MGRLLLLAAVVGFGGLLGCSSTWETVSSRKFKQRPFHTMFGSDEDPLHVLRTSPEGGERAAAMMRLKEPITNGGTQADQDEVVEHILGPAATSDPSPVVRAAAIDALGRFKDPRAPQLLTAAYYKAAGRSATDPLSSPAAALSAVQQASGGRELGTYRDRLNLDGPSGFSPDATLMLKARCLDALARTNSQEGIDLLTRVAEGQTTGNEEPINRDTRLAAVRGLTMSRRTESVVALQKVLASESNRDTGLASRAHAGLVELTGKDLPPDPQKWGEVVQTGVQVAPEKSGLERAVGSLTSTGK